MLDAARNPIARLLERLDLDQEAAHTFIGGSGPAGTGAADRLFGGLVAAQAYVAAARTASVGPIHSLHLYFLRPGRASVPIRYEVDDLKQGRRFEARQVRAIQGDQIIFQMMASFSDNSPGVEHQDAMPAVPPAESLANRDEARGKANWQQQPIDLRTDDPDGEGTEPDHWIWMRPMQPIVGDEVARTAALIFATDRALLGTVALPHSDAGQFAGASLDHTIWFHEAIDFTDWHLHAMHSPVARHERGLVFGSIYRADGTRVATTAQEGSIRFAGR
ncbi:MAG: acyl-CoA thioesterase [Ilumatobacter sp.]